MPTHPLRNFEMQNQNEFNFNGAYSRNKGINRNSLDSFAC